MGLIRKPDASVFEDSATVKVARTTKVVAVEGGATMMQTASRLWLALILGVFILTGLGAMMSAGWLRGLIALPFIAAAAWALIRLFRAPTRTDAFEADANAEWAAPSAAAAYPVEALRVKYWPKALFNKASLLIFASPILLISDGASVGWLMGLGVVFLAGAILLLSPLYGTRDCLVADRREITVHALLEKTTVPTHQIGDICLKTFERRDWWTQLNTGSRHHVSVVALTGEGRKELLIPYTLLGLDKDGACKLMAKLMALREQAVAPAAQSYLQPRAPARAAESSAVALEGFDPDAIMARYLAEREQVRAAAELPPVVAQPVRPTFGRKRMAG